MRHTLNSVGDLDEAPLSLLDDIENNKFVHFVFTRTGQIENAIFDKRFVRRLRALAYASSYDKAILIYEEPDESPIYLLMPCDCMEGPWPSEHQKVKFLNCLRMTLECLTKEDSFIGRELNLITTESPEGYRCSNLIRQCIDLSGQSRLQVIYPGFGMSSSPSHV